MPLRVKGVEFETVGYEYRGNQLQFVTSWKSIRTDDVFETGRNGPVWAFSEDFETDFGLKQNGGVMGVARGYGRDCWEFHICWTVSCQEFFDN